MSLDFGIIACELFQLRELRLHVRVHLNGKYVIRSESDSQEKIDIPIEFSRIIARKSKRHVWDNGCMLAYQSNLGLRNLGLIRVVQKFA